MLPVPPIMLRPSRRALSWVYGVYLLGAAIPIKLPVPMAVKLLLIALILGDGWLWRRRLRRCYGVRALRVTVDHRLQIEPLGLAAWMDVEVLPDSYLWPFFIILHIRRPGSRRSERWFLLPDMMSREEWRSLKVWVKWRLPELMPKRTSLRERLLRKLGAAVPKRTKAP